MPRAADLSRRADPDTRAYVHAWLGLELAAIGREREFLAAYETAARLAQQPGHGDGRGYLTRRMLSWRLHPEQAANRGIGLVRVGRAGEAIEALAPTLDPHDPTWNAIALTDIAAAWVAQGEPEQACATLVRALDAAQASGYAMGIARIRGVRAQLFDLAHLPSIAELDERLELVMRASR